MFELSFYSDKLWNLTKNNSVQTAQRCSVLESRADPQPARASLHRQPTRSSSRSSSGPSNHSLFLQPVWDPQPWLASYSCSTSAGQPETLKPSQPARAHFPNQSARAHLPSWPDRASFRTQPTRSSYLVSQPEQLTPASQPEPTSSPTQPKPLSPASQPEILSPSQPARSSYPSSQPEPLKPGWPARVSVPVN